MNWLLPLLFFVTTAIGVFLAGRQIVHRRIFVSFSAGVLLAVCLLFLIPDALKLALIFPAQLTWLCILVSMGFLTLLGLERFLFKGVLHHHCGHLDVHEHCPSEEHHQQGYMEHESRLLITLVVALCAHSFFDGLLVGVSVKNQQIHLFGLMLGFALHKIPESAAFTISLNHGESSKRFKMALLLIYTMASPVGFFVGQRIPHLFDGRLFYYVLAFLAGGLLHFVTGHLLPDSMQQKQSKNAGQFIALLVGFLVMVAARFVE